MRQNPYMVPGARVRVVQWDGVAYWGATHAKVGDERTIHTMSQDGEFVTLKDDYGHLHASRFKPVVRVKMGRRPLGVGVPDAARLGDIVYNANRTHYAVVHATVWGPVNELYLSPWWVA